MYTQIVTKFWFQITQIWNQFLALIWLACCLEPKTSPPSGLAAFSVEKWNADALAFGMANASRWATEKVTTCIHILIYLVGFFIDRLGSIEHWGNYVIEGLHQQLKRGNNCFVDAHSQCRRWLLSSFQHFQVGLWAANPEKPSKKKHWTEFAKKTTTAMTILPQYPIPQWLTAHHGPPTHLGPAGPTILVCPAPASPALLTCPHPVALLSAAASASIAHLTPSPLAHTPASLPHVTLLPHTALLSCAPAFSAPPIATPTTSLALIPSTQTYSSNHFRLSTASSSSIQPVPDSAHLVPIRALNSTCTCKCICQSDSKHPRRVRHWC